MSILRSIYSTFSLACGGPGGSVGRGPEPRPTYLYRRPGSGRMTWRLMVSFGGWRVARHGGPPALAVAHGDHTPTLRSGLELSQGDHTPTLRYNPLVPREVCVGGRKRPIGTRPCRRRRAGCLARDPRRRLAHILTVAWATRELRPDEDLARDKILVWAAWRRDG